VTRCEWNEWVVGRVIARHPNVVKATASVETGVDGAKFAHEGHDERRAYDRSDEK